MFSFIDHKSYTVSLYYYLYVYIITSQIPQTRDPVFIFCFQSSNYFIF